VSKINPAFACIGWCDLYPNHALRALSTCASDHAPLLLHTDLTAPGKQRFHFGSIWPRFTGYLDAIVDGWHGASAHADIFRSLDIKMRNMAKVLKQWSQKFVGSVRFQLAVPKEVIFKLEKAQDTRHLSMEELELRIELKFKCLGFTSLARTIARQCLHILHLKEGDANTHYFQLQACHCSRKSFIDRLTHHGCTLVDEEEKADVIFQHFSSIFGDEVPRARALNFKLLQLPKVDLSGNDCCFSEYEVWSTICVMPADKAPNPDGFTGLFYRMAWPVIKGDVMRAFHALWSLDFRSLYLVNQSYTILLRKCATAEEIKDYRPISLLHRFCKTMTKVLAVRVSPFMNELVQPNQSAFIKGRAIHDNFRSVQSSAKLLHTHKRPCVLLKIDIAKAFDTVSWPFLIELLASMGFSCCWTNWISALLSIGSSRILLNGSPRQGICHARGLRQGDPLFALPLCASHGSVKHTLPACRLLGSPGISPYTSNSASSIPLRQQFGHLCLSIRTRPVLCSGCVASIC
jgi:hypothetical protein